MVLNIPSAKFERHLDTAFNNNKFKHLVNPKLARQLCYMTVADPFQLKLFYSNIF